jgi:diguanylate cyclase (GGDEF)-like protein
MNRIAKWLSLGDFPIQGELKMKKAIVTVRDGKNEVEIKISGLDKPDIHPVFIEKWQRLLDLLSKVFKVPTGLIMKVTETNMEVFMHNKNVENPYAPGDVESLGCGLYCETVLGMDSELEVPNALNSDVWKDNPDVALNMISYYGLPIKWPDGEFYGTLCVLDEKENHYSEEFKLIIDEFLKSIEKDLEILIMNRNLKFFSEVDALTGTYNRRYCDAVLENEFNRSKRSSQTFSIAMIDLNGFKEINDTHGHDMGDRVLKEFSSIFMGRVRSVDTFGRYGGDEFILICPDTDGAGVETMVSSLSYEVELHMKESMPKMSFSYGIAEFSPEDKNYDSICKRADTAMYEMKESHKRT